MMQGHVNQQCEAVISVAVRGGSQLKSVDAVIDTGFNGFLSLPISIIVELGLIPNPLYRVEEKTACNPDSV